MTGEAKKNDSGYMGFEYREITVSKKYISLYMDSYPCFGWEPDPNRRTAPGDSPSAPLKGTRAENGDRKPCIFAGNEVFLIKLSLPGCSEILTAALRRSKN